MALVLLLIFFLILKVVFSPSLWEDEYQFSFSYPTNDGVVVSVLNPTTNSATNLFIPNNTQMQVADQLGGWRLGSVWELGKQEKVGGYLLSRSLAKTFYMPVDAWAEKTMKDYDSGLWSRTKAIFLTTDTNIKFKDKLMLWLFMFSLPKGNNQDIDLRETSVLSQSRLPDGSEGFVPDALNDRVERLFFVDILSQENKRVGITNVANNSGPISMIAGTFETMGINPVVIKDEDYDEEFLCAVYTQDKASYTAKKISLVFDCPIKEKRSPSNLDIDFVYGGEFARRF